MVTLEDVGPGTFLVRNATSELSQKLKFAIPTSGRTYSPDGWVVRKSFLPQVKHWINKLNLNSEDISTKNTKNDFYEVLHLTQDAPDYVVDAVWKILARKYHPDSIDGNQETFIKYKSAYEKIRG